MMRRSEVVQSYLNLFEKPTYLEIGVSEGETFHALSAHRKIAVDPHFRFTSAERESASVYMEMKSDEYFGSLNSSARFFHVVYLDGLHTFKQTLRDLLNTIEYIYHDGIIIIDDVLPTSYPSSLPDVVESIAVREMVGDTDPSWMGDVYRLVYFIQSFMPRYDYATVQENHGQLVMWRGDRLPNLFRERKVEDISRMDFRHLAAERSQFNFLPNVEIVERIGQTRLKRALSYEHEEV